MRFRGPHALLLEQINALWEGGDLSSIDDLYAEDFSMNGQAVGREGVRQAVQARRAAFSDVQFTVNDLLTVGDQTMVRFEQTGRHTGLLRTAAGELPATGRTFRVNGIEVWRFENNRAVEAWGIFDRLDLLSQLGAFDSD